MPKTKTPTLVLLNIFDIFGGFSDVITSTFIIYFEALNIHPCACINIDFRTYSTFECIKKIT